MMKKNGRIELEEILGAAIWHEAMGVYWLPKPFRHAHVMAVMAVDGYGMKYQEAEGFWTNRDRFVTRLEAFKIASKNGQFKRRPGGYDGLELFSEDLW